MNAIEIITASNSGRLEEIGKALAQTYKKAFAGEPWYEVSKCADPTCEAWFSDLQPGCECVECQATLTEAYDEQELVAWWQQMVEEDGAMMEIAMDGSYPQRATIARPTNPEELFLRKYSAIPEMQGWLAKVLPDNFVWIEDTFADRTRLAKGNLNGRGQTLARIALFYRDNPIIATRTLVPGIVRATLRDAPASTDIFIGKRAAGKDIANEFFDNPNYELPAVPDERTLLIIKDAEDLS